MLTVHEFDDFEVIEQDCLEAHASKADSVHAKVCPIGRLSLQLVQLPLAEQSMCSLLISAQYWYQ